MRCGAAHPAGLLRSSPQPSAPLDPGGVSNDAGAALQDAAVDADIVNPHEAASREGETPVSL